MIVESRRIPASRHTWSLRVEKTKTEKLLGLTYGCPYNHRRLSDVEASSFEKRAFRGRYNAAERFITRPGTLYYPLALLVAMDSSAPLPTIPQIPMDKLFGSVLVGTFLGLVYVNCHIQC